MTIPMFKVFMSNTAAGAVKNVLNSGYIGQGPVVDRFERKLKEYLRSPVDVLTLNSCTSALELALHLIGVGPGDEVITSALACTASTGAIIRAGATPVWADIQPNGLIKPSSVAECMSSKTKAVLAIDWAGWPCDYEALQTKTGVPVIEDAAHAFGARHQGESIANSGGDYVCWSFQAIKHLTSGDGGAIVCPPDQVERARLLRWFGLDRKSSTSYRCNQSIQESGFKMHMNDINAAIGLANIDEVDWVVSRHQNNAAFYDRNLPEQCLIHSTADSGSCWIYNIVVPEREKFEQWVKERGRFDVSQVHSRNDRHPAFSKARSPVPLDNLDFFSSNVTAIPVHWAVGKDERDLIVGEVRSWCKSH